MAERGMAAIFTQIYDTNRWRGQTGSGPGSVLRGTQLIRERLPSLLEDRSVSVFLDAPCGDFNWIKAVDLPVDSYIGLDVVAEVIERNRREHARADRIFDVCDITTDPLPRADLMLCRDCLVHFTAEDAMRAVGNVKASGCEYLLTTTFFALEDNLPGSTGGWRPLNLELPPFSFPAPIELIRERVFDPGARYSDKALGLWRVDDLPATLTGATG